MIVTDRERLDHLRRRLAAAERVSVVARIQADVNAFAEYAPEPLLVEIAELQDRCSAKAERLGGDPAPKLSRKLRALCQSVLPGAGATPGTSISMRIGGWTIDDNGVAGRVIWNAADGLRPPKLPVVTW
jgi:hypothetical protein